MPEPVGPLVIVTFDDITSMDPTYVRAKKAGIHLAGEDLDRKQAGMDKGTILAIGEGCNFLSKDNPPKLGDYIGFARHSGKVITDVDDLEQKYLIINDEDVQVIYRRA